VAGWNRFAVVGVLVLSSTHVNTMIVQQQVQIGTRTAVRCLSFVPPSFVPLNCLVDTVVSHIGARISLDGASDASASGVDSEGNE
jgi:hypothetical protein